MSYINTALINKLSKEVEEIKVRLEVLESATKPQQKVAKAASTEVKDGLSGTTLGVAKGTDKVSLEIPQTLLKADTDD